MFRLFKILNGVRSDLQPAPRLFLRFVRRRWCEAVDIERRHLPVAVEINDPDGVAICIRDEQLSRGDGEAGRFVEGRLLRRAVVVAGFPGAGDGAADARFQVENLDLVVVGVGNVELAVGVCDADGVLQQGARRLRGVAPEGGGGDRTLYH